MTERESAADIEAKAARWVVRVDRGDLTTAERADLELWLDGDTRRRGAYVRACAAWSLLDRAEEAQVPPRGVAPRLLAALRRRDVLAGLGAAAAAACAAVVIGPRVASVKYATALGEIRRVPLADGSMAAINTSTSLGVSLKPDVRRVKLDRGEAWFQVAKEPDRPFVVESGSVRVRAVGTAFSVRRRDDGSDVLVTEGIVEVWSQASPDNHIRLAAGERTFVSDAAGAAPPAVAGPAIARNLAWREGQIILEGEPLVDAVAEFNRYNERKIVIADPSLQGERLVGWFRTNDPEGFAKAAAASLGGGVQIAGNTILVHAGSSHPG
jgi:transmembrane sensor